MDYIAKKTGKKVKWYGVESYAAQVEAMRSGRFTDSTDDSRPMKPGDGVEDKLLTTRK